MPQKRHKPEEIVAKLPQVDVVASQGQSVAEAVRSIGVTALAGASDGSFISETRHIRCSVPVSGSIVFRVG